jgi:hypothetical protein
MQDIICSWLIHHVCMRAVCVDVPCIWQAWLRKEVTGAVFQTLYDLQHPNNCSATKQLYCNLGKHCGFGCQLHHVVHCFATAVALNRTMVVNVSVEPAAAAAAAAAAIFAIKKLELLACAAFS